MKRGDKKNYFAINPGKVQLKHWIIPSVEEKAGESNKY